MSQTHIVTIHIDEQTKTIEVADGANLRRSLLEAGISPYAAITRTINCGGRGICATCGVVFEAGEPAPDNWHDRLAAHFGYPRLSCQISVRGAMTVRILTDKVIWGQRDPSRRFVSD